MIIAHVFLAPYTLQVPFWMYLYGCAATLVLSSALLAYLATSSVSTHHHYRRAIFAAGSPRKLWRRTVFGLRAAAVAALVMTIAAGVAGPTDPALNIGMTLFWVYFLLAFVYLTAVIGDLYHWINPWSTLSELLRRFGVDVDRARVRYPLSASYWPAVAGYVALVWIELFALPRPFTLAAVLVAYTAVMLAGILTFGRAVWLRHADMFEVLFRVIGSLAPIEYMGGSNETPGVLLRWPLSGALAARADHPSLVAFVLFMLSSTTYDAIHETYLWISLYWQRLLPLLQPLWGSDVIAAQAALTTGYRWYQWIGLVASPAFYFAVYLMVLWLALVLTRVPIAMEALAGTFIFSLVPIAVAYHATHYVPSMLQQLPALLPQLADPFGRGWRLLPFRLAPTPPLPMAVVWHTQVAVLLTGHVCRRVPGACCGAASVPDTPSGRCQPAADAGADGRLYVPGPVDPLVAAWTAADRPNRGLAAVSIGLRAGVKTTSPYGALHRISR